MSTVKDNFHTSVSRGSPSRGEMKEEQGQKEKEAQGDGSSGYRPPDGRCPQQRGLLESESSLHLNIGSVKYHTQSRKKRPNQLVQYDSKEDPLKDTGTPEDTWEPSQELASGRSLVTAPREARRGKGITKC